MSINRQDQVLPDFKGTVKWKQFFGVLSENMLSNKMPHKGLTVFSTLLASSFNWGAPCKSEVTTMGFISKIAVFLRRENISKCYFFQDFFSFPCFPHSTRGRDCCTF